MTVTLMVYIPHGREGPRPYEISFNPSTTVATALEEIRSAYNLPDDSDYQRLGIFMMNDDNGQFEQEDKFEKGQFHIFPNKF